MKMTLKPLFSETINFAIHTQLLHHSDNTNDQQQLPKITKNINNKNKLRQ